MNRILLFVGLISLTFLNDLIGQVRLPALFSSNMVLQRDTLVQIWGWSEAQEKITIQPSWLKTELSVMADHTGKWRIGLPTTASKEAQTILFKGKDTEVAIENILFGEVWLCSGQSNMQMPVKGNMGEPIHGALQAIISARNPNLRLFTIQNFGSMEPLSDIERYRSWTEATPESVSNFSAVAYFFGEQLQHTLDIPVGIIHSSWGGSFVEAWISRDSLQGYHEILPDSAYDLTKANRVPTALYNAMINPLIPLTIKGVLWYQGESNRLDPGQYLKLFPLMVGDWRARWGLGNFPFYFAQIAPFSYGKSKEAFETSENSAFIRESQLKCSEIIANSGIAITMDLGDETSIHPPSKKEVADRLLYLALQQTYNFKGLNGRSPSYKSSVIGDKFIRLNFNDVGSGLYTFGDLKHFEIAGEDRVFYPAVAKIVNRTAVEVSSDKVLKPVAVRYGWKNYLIGDLYGGNLLPVSSFRTDDWDDASRAQGSK